MSTSRMLPRILSYFPASYHVAFITSCYLPEVSRNSGPLYSIPEVVFINTALSHPIYLADRVVHASARPLMILRSIS